MLAGGPGRPGRRGGTRLRSRGRDQRQQAERRRQQDHHHVLGWREVQRDGTEVDRRPLGQLDLSREVVLHRKARHVNLGPVRNVRRDEVGRSGLLGGRRGLRRGRGALRRERRERRERKGERKDAGDCQAKESHGFKKTGSIRVETKKKPAILRSVGAVESPSTFTPKNPNATSATARSIIPSPQPAITFAGCIIRTSVNASACTITTVIALAHAERTTSSPGTARVMIHAPRPVTAIVTAMNPPNRFIASCSRRPCACLRTSGRETSSRTRRSPRSTRQVA